MHRPSQGIVGLIAEGGDRRSGEAHIDPSTEQPLTCVFADQGLGGDAGIRTRVRGFAGPCLNHSATSP